VQVVSVCVLLPFLIGSTIGLVSGYFGGWIDLLTMRFVDILWAFPFYVLVISIVGALGPSTTNIYIAFSLVVWISFARIVRGEVLLARRLEYTQAVSVLGYSHARIMLRHILPNAIAPVIVAATFGMANAILLEAGLSFLGLGVQPPTPSWGNMLTDAQSLTVLESMPWLWIPPGAMIALAVLSINFIGDGLRDALDPYLVR
jgi:peptide/nickel transport system permease protein